MNWLESLLALFKKPAPAPVQSPAAPAAVLNPDSAWLSLCVPLTKASEGCRLIAYPDPATNGPPWTIGYGATGVGISQGVVWSQAQADARLSADLQRFAASVDSLVTVPLLARQKAALVDFVYNLGPGAFAGSTLLKKLNSGDYDGAADQFSIWNLANGKVMTGIVIRRTRERSLFLTGAWK